MKILIEVADDVITKDVTAFMKTLNNEILNRDEFKSIIKDVKVTPK